MKAPNQRLSLTLKVAVAAMVGKPVLGVLFLYAVTSDSHVWRNFIGSFSVALLLAVFVARGHSWARWLFAAWAVEGIVHGAWTFARLPGQLSLQLYIIANHTIQTTAAILLFLPSSHPHFRQEEKPNQASEPPAPSGRGSP
jgi:hypothetical protein